MAERASRLMSADEFLAWDDGTDTRYELIDGVPVAFVPGGASHVQVTGNITRIADDAVRDRRPAGPFQAEVFVFRRRHPAGSTSRTCS